MLGKTFVLSVFVGLLSVSSLLQAAPVAEVNPPKRATISEKVRNSLTELGHGEYTRLAGLLNPTRTKEGFRVDLPPGVEKSFNAATLNTEIDKLKDEALKAKYKALVTATENLTAADKEMVAMVVRNAIKAHVPAEAKESVGLSGEGSGPKEKVFADSTSLTGDSLSFAVDLNTASNALLKTGYKANRMQPDGKMAEQTVYVNETHLQDVVQALVVGGARATGKLPTPVELQKLIVQGLEYMAHAETLAAAQGGEGRPSEGSHVGETLGGTGGTHATANQMLVAKIANGLASDLNLRMGQSLTKTGTLSWGELPTPSEMTKAEMDILGKAHNALEEMWIKAGTMKNGKTRLDNYEALIKERIGGEEAYKAMCGPNAKPCPDSAAFCPARYGLAI